MKDKPERYSGVRERIRQQAMVRNPACVYPDSEKCGNCGTYRRNNDGIIEKCPNCRDDEYELLTEAEFENLVDKASQPVEPERKPDTKEAGTLESQTSDDCNESHTR